MAPYTVPTVNVTCSQNGTDFAAVDGFRSLLEGNISSVTACNYESCTLFHWKQGSQDLVEVQCTNDVACALGTYNDNNNIWSAGMENMEQTAAVNDGQVLSLKNTVETTAHPGVSTAFANGLCAVRAEVAPYAGDIFVTVALWRTEPPPDVRHTASSKVRINEPKVLATETPEVSTSTESPEVSTSTEVTPPPSVLPPDFSTRDLPTSKSNTLVWGLGLIYLLVA